jgi:hypothetical protein
LQSAQPVEKNRHASEVGVLTQRRTSVVYWLWWSFDKPHLVAAYSVLSVQVG